MWSELILSDMMEKHSAFPAWPAYLFHLKKWVNQSMGVNKPLLTNLNEMWNQFGSTVLHKAQPSWVKEGGSPDDIDLYICAYVCLCAQASGEWYFLLLHHHWAVQSTQQWWSWRTCVNGMVVDLCTSIVRIYTARSQWLGGGFVISLYLFPSLWGKIHYPKHLGSDPLYSPMRLAESLPETLKETICLDWRGAYSTLYNNKRSETYHRSQLWWNIWKKVIFNM